MIKAYFWVDEFKNWHGRIYNDEPNGYGFEVESDTLAGCLNYLAAELRSTTPQTKLERLTETSPFLADQEASKIKALAIQFNEFAETTTKDYADLLERVERLEHFRRQYEMNQEHQRDRTP